MNNQNSDSGGDGRNKGRAIFLSPLDLSSLESVRSFAKAFTSEYPHLNILVNNAGLAHCPGRQTNDGMDLCFQTNFVGPYLLTRILLPHLLKAKNTFPSKEGGIANNGFEAGRVVNLSSVTHHFASASTQRAEGIKVSGVHDAEFWKGCATPNVSGATYFESKVRQALKLYDLFLFAAVQVPLCIIMIISYRVLLFIMSTFLKLAMIVFTQELNERYASLGLRAVAVNPGSVASDIWRGYPPLALKIIKQIFLTIKQGSSTSVAAAIGDLPQDALYLQPYYQPWGKKVFSNSKSSPYLWYSLPHPITETMGPYVGFAVTDCRLPPRESRSALWNVCEEIVGLKEKAI